MTEALVVKSVAQWTSFAVVEFGGAKRVAVRPIHAPVVASVCRRLCFWSPKRFLAMLAIGFLQIIGFGIQGEGWNFFDLSRRDYSDRFEPSIYVSREEKQALSRMTSILTVSALGLSSLPSSRQISVLRIFTFRLMLVSIAQITSTASTPRTWLNMKAFSTHTVSLWNRSRAFMACVRFLSSSLRFRDTRQDLKGMSWGPTTIAPTTAKPPFVGETTSIPINHPFTTWMMGTCGFVALPVGHGL